MVLFTSSSNVVEKDINAYVMAHLMKTTDINTEYFPDGAIWSMSLYRNTTHEAIRSVMEKSILITVEDSEDLDGNMYDIDVVGEVSF